MTNQTKQTEIKPSLKYHSVELEDTYENKLKVRLDKTENG